MRPPRPRAIAVAVACALFSAASAGAESALRLDLPHHFGTIPAATYDTDRERIGAAHLVLERQENGMVRIFSDSGFERGARTVVTAELVPAPGDSKLKPVVQESRTFDSDGTPRGVLRIDHREGLASCTPNGDGAVVRTLELPDPDRVANVPMNLFFLPLVRGTAERLDFQLFLCSGGPRLVDFQATRAPSNGRNGSHDVVEIRYGPELPAVLSFVAPRFLPRLSFWFDPSEPHRWLAHRVPLYGDGPEVLVIRDGIPPGWLSDE